MFNYVINIIDKIIVSHPNKNQENKDKYMKIYLPIVWDGFSPSYKYVQCFVSKAHSAILIRALFK